MKAFAFDTTLAGRGYVHHIRVWQAAGYRVKLIFLQLDGPEEAIARVAQCARVQQFVAHVVSPPGGGCTGSAALASTSAA